MIKPDQVIEIIFTVNLPVKKANDWVRINSPGGDQEFLDELTGSGREKEMEAPDSANRNWAMANRYVELPDDHTEVHAFCRNALYRPYYDRFLARVAQRFPEARDDLAEAVADPNLAKALPKLKEHLNSQKKEETMLTSSPPHYGPSLPTDLPAYLVQGPAHLVTKTLLLFTNGYDDSGVYAFDVQSLDDKRVRMTATHNELGLLGKVELVDIGVQALLHVIRPTVAEPEVVQRYMEIYSMDRNWADLRIYERRQEKFEWLLRNLLDQLEYKYGLEAGSSGGTSQFSSQDNGWIDSLKPWANQVIHNDARLELPWIKNVPLSLEDVDAACHEHLEHLAGKRFPAEWDVQVWRAVEQEGSAIRFDIRSANRPVGHLRIRRITAQRTRLELTSEPNAAATDPIRLREIIGMFFGRWLGDLDSLAQPSAAEVAPTDEPASDDKAADTSGSQLEVFPTLEIPLAPDKLFTWLEWKFLAPRNLTAGIVTLTTGKRFQYEPSPGPNYIGVFLNIEVLEDEFTLVAPEILYSHQGLKEQAQLEVERLRTELEEHLQKIAQPATLTSGPIVLQRKPPGRKPDPENDVACQMLVRGNWSNEAYLEAFRYWCKSKGIAKPGKPERDAFKKAMQRAESRRNKQDAETN